VMDVSRNRRSGAPRTGPNIVQRAPETHSPNSHDASNSPPGSAPDEVKETVYGLLYSLPPDDEERLDLAEGVPVCYGKEWLYVRFWPLDSNAPLAQAASAEKVKTLGEIVDPYHPGRNETKARAPPSPAPRAEDVPPKGVIPPGRAHVQGNGEARLALVYVDRQRLTPSPIMEEYISRIWRGVAEAEERGVPAEWMEKVIVPSLEGEVRD
jgi:hypothetical protein